MRVGVGGGEGVLVSGVGEGQGSCEAGVCVGGPVGVRGRLGVRGRVGASVVGVSKVGESVWCRADWFWVGGVRRPRNGTNRARL